MSAIVFLVSAGVRGVDVRWGSKLSERRGINIAMARSPRFIDRPTDRVAVGSVRPSTATAATAAGEITSRPLMLLLLLLHDYRSKRHPAKTTSRQNGPGKGLNGPFSSVQFVQKLMFARSLAEDRLVAVAQSIGQ